MMQAFAPPRGHQRGNAMIVVVVAIVVAAALIAALYFSSRSANRAATLHSEAERAFAAADFGMQRAVNRLENVRAKTDPELNAWLTNPTDQPFWMTGEMEGMEFRVQIRSVRHMQNDPKQSASIPSQFTATGFLVDPPKSGNISGMKDVLIISSTAQNRGFTEVTAENPHIRPTVEAVCRIEGKTTLRPPGHPSAYFTPKPGNLRINNDQLKASGEDHLQVDHEAIGAGPGEVMFHDNVKVNTTPLESKIPLKQRMENLFARGRISLRMRTDKDGEIILINPKFDDPNRLIKNDPQSGDYVDPFKHLRDADGKWTPSVKGPFSQGEVASIYIAVETDKTEYSGLKDYTLNIDEVDRYESLNDKGEVVVTERVMTRNFVMSPPEDDPQAPRKVLITKAEDTPDGKGVYSDYWYKELVDQWWSQACPTCNNEYNGGCPKCKGLGYVTITYTDYQGTKRTATFPCLDCLDPFDCPTCGGSRIVDTPCTYKTCQGKGTLDACPECYGFGYYACTAISYNATEAAKYVTGATPLLFSTSGSPHLCTYTSNNYFVPTTYVQKYIVAGEMLKSSDYPLKNSQKNVAPPPAYDFDYKAAGVSAPKASSGLVACPFCYTGAKYIKYDTSNHKVSSIASGTGSVYAYGIKGWTFPYTCPVCTVYSTSSTWTPSISGRKFVCPDCNGKPIGYVPCPECHVCPSCTNSGSGKHSTCDTSCKNCTKKSWKVLESTCTVCKGAAKLRCTANCTVGVTTPGYCPTCDSSGLNYKTDPIREDCACGGDFGVSGCKLCNNTGYITYPPPCPTCQGSGQSVPPVLCTLCVQGYIPCTNTACVGGKIPGVQCTRCIPNGGWLKEEAPAYQCPRDHVDGGYVIETCWYCNPNGTNPNPGINPHRKPCVCNSWDAEHGGLKGYALCASCEGKGIIDCAKCKQTGRNPDGDKECPICHGAGKVSTTCSSCVNKRSSGKCITCRGVGARDEDKIYPVDFRINEDLSVYGVELPEGGTNTKGEPLKTVSLMICHEDLPSRALDETDKGIADFDYNDFVYMLDMIATKDEGDGGTGTTKVMNRWWKMDQLESLTGDQSIYALTTNPTTKYTTDEDGNVVRARETTGEDYNRVKKNTSFGSDLNKQFSTMTSSDDTGLVTLTTFPREDYTRYYDPPTAEQLAAPGGKDITSRFDQSGYALAYGPDAFEHANVKYMIDTQDVAGNAVGGSVKVLSNVLLYDNKGNLLVDDDGNPWKPKESVKAKFIANESSDGTERVRVDGDADVTVFNSVEDIWRATKEKGDRSALGEFHTMDSGANNFVVSYLSKEGSNPYRQDEEGNYKLAPVMFTDPTDKTTKNVPYNEAVDRNRSGYACGPDGNLYQIMAKNDMPFDVSGIRTDNDLPDFRLDQRIEGAGVMVVNGNLFVENEFNFAGILIVTGDLIVNPLDKDGKKDNTPRMNVQGQVFVGGRFDPNSTVNILKSEAIANAVGDRYTRLITNTIGYNKRPGSTSDWEDAAIRK